MWIHAVAPERIAELFENYQSALGVFGPKGSECGSWKESQQQERTQPREQFAETDEAEWGY
jgi:hypothetical protein